MEVLFEKQFHKDLKSLERKLLGQIERVINQVQLAQSTQDIPNLRKLKGFESFYRIRLEAYRIGISLQGNKVFL